MTTKQKGWAAITHDGHDLGAGWATEAEAVAELSGQMADMAGVEIYLAVSDDEWRSWERADG